MTSQRYVDICGQALVQSLRVLQEAADTLVMLEAEVGVDGAGMALQEFREAHEKANQLGEAWEAARKKHLGQA